MDALEAMRSRRSVRKYEERDIPRETIEAIADCGRLAPSGHNKQPWTFAVVTDRDLLKAIAACAEYGRFIAGAGACVAVFCGESATALEDACAATENMIVAAAASGLGSCWVASYRRSHASSVSELLSCPPGLELMTLLALGYPANDSRRRKKDLAEVLRWNGWRS